jgi:PIN domain nuclease of toxin-antitoxin system
VAFWYFDGGLRISQEVLGILRDPIHDVYFSDVSVLEIVIKHGLGRLRLPQPPSRLLPSLARKHEFEILPLITAAIFRLETLPSLHRDPFDRLLIGQALAHHLTLVTPDPLIRQYRVATLWA